MIYKCKQIRIYLIAEELFTVDLLSISEIQKKLKEQGYIVSEVTLRKWKQFNYWDETRNETIEAIRAARVSRVTKKVR